MLSIGPQPSRQEPGRERSICVAAPGIVHRGHLRPRREEGGERRGVLGAPLDSQSRRAQAAERKPRVERREIASEEPRIGVQPVARLVSGVDEEHATADVAVTGEVLGEAVDDEVSSVRERLEEHRRGERRVDDALRRRLDAQRR